MEKIAILDYSTAQLTIVEVEEHLQTEEIEELLEEAFNFRIKDISWMAVQSISMDNIRI